MDQLEGRNPVLECLSRHRREVRRIWLDRGAKADPKIAEILRLAGERAIRVDRVDRRELDKMSKGRVHNGIVAHADPLTGWSTRALLDAQVCPGGFVMVRVRGVTIVVEAAVAGF